MFPDIGRKVGWEFIQFMKVERKYEAQYVYIYVLHLYGTFLL